LIQLQPEEVQQTLLTRFPRFTTLCQAQSKAAAADGCDQLAITADESMILAAAAELPSEDTMAVIAIRTTEAVFRLQKLKMLKVHHIIAS